MNSAVYVYRSADAEFGRELSTLLQQLAIAYAVPPEFNIVKFRLDELKISFLLYPDFFAAAHPALREAITIDLARGKSRKTDYSKQANPPILHRKETFLPRDHERWPLYHELTEAEEAAGLYEDTTTIGFLLNWERLLAAKRLAIEDHTLRHVADADAVSFRVPKIEIDRHKTALTRYDLSKPAKSLLEHGLLTKDRSFFDYGCGLGNDVRALRALGYACSGWDAVHRSDTAKEPADVTRRLRESTTGINYAA